MRRASAAARSSAAAARAERPENAACGPAYHANATRQLRLAPKEGFGVLFVAHHGDDKRKQAFIAQAITSANSYRDASIQLPRVLITSAGGPPLPGARPRRQCGTKDNEGHAGCGCARCARCAELTQHARRVCILQTATRLTRLCSSRRACCCPT
jgi:hypothetical protein